jgi:hypothetical protein
MKHDVNYHEYITAAEQWMQNIIDHQVKLTFRILRLFLPLKEFSSQFITLQKGQRLADVFMTYVVLGGSTSAAHALFFRQY